MAISEPQIMTKEEAGEYFKSLRLRRKPRITQQEVVDGTTVPNIQYLSALENGRYNVLNSEHFSSLVKFFGLDAEEIERIRPGTVIVAPSHAAFSPSPPLRPIPSELQEMIDEKAKLAPELATERWQQYLAGQRFSTGTASPDRWWNLFLTLKNAGVEPGGN